MLTQTLIVLLVVFMVLALMSLSRAPWREGWMLSSPALLWIALAILACIVLVPRLPGPG